MDPRILVSLSLCAILLRPYPITLLGRLGARIGDFSVFLVLVIFYVFIFVSNNRIKINQVSFLLFLLFTQMVFSALFGLFFLDVDVVLRDIFELYRIPYFFLLFSLSYQMHWNEKSINHFYITPFLLLGTIIIFFGIGQRLHVPGTYIITSLLYCDVEKLERHDRFGRIVGTLGNPNIFGIFLVWLVLLFFILLIIRKRKIFLPVILLCFLSIWWTSSRTSLLVMLITLMFLIYILYKARLAPLRKILFTFFVLFISVILLLNYAILYSNNPYMIDFLNKTLEGNILQVNSLEKRIDLWNEQWELIKISPVMGWGPAKLETTSVSDNQYIFTLKRYGVIGLSVFVSLFVLLYRRAMLFLRKVYLQEKKPRSYETVFVVFFLCMLFSLLLGNMTGEFSDDLQLGAIFYLTSGIMCKIFYQNINLKST
jgi:O-antigen ligase